MPFISRNVVLTLAISKQLIWFFFYLSPVNVVCNGKESYTIIIFKIISFYKDTI